jgi:hypothetical protein
MIIILNFETFQTQKLTSLITVHKSKYLVMFSFHQHVLSSAMQFPGCVIAQVVSYWLLTMEAWIHTQGSPCGICGGQSGTRASFSQSPSVFPRQYHSTAAPYSLMYHTGGWTMSWLMATVPQRQSLPPSQ